MPPPHPKVSVSIITYNQRKVIGRAIDSVLMQRTDFPFEIIIGDDCSDDGTQDVLRAYQRRYPDVVQIILHPRRYDEVPGRTNNVTNLTNCRGKYTAMLDGDDYWTDPDKLQRQVDRMEADPEIAMCVHDSRIVHEPAIGVVKKELVSGYGAAQPTGYYAHVDVARRRLFAQISTICFRTRCFDYFPDWFYDVVPADKALLLLISREGRVWYDAEPASVYVINPQSFVNAHFVGRALTERRLADYDLFAREFPETYLPPSQQKMLAHLYFRLFKMDLARGKLLAAGKWGYGMLQRSPLYPLKAARAAARNRYRAWRYAPTRTADSRSGPVPPPATPGTNQPLSPPPYTR